MGFAAIRDLDIREYARPILEELRDQLNETVHLGIPYGQNILYVEGVESRHQLRSGSRVGTFVPAHCISLGKALLAALSREELRHLYPEAKLPALTGRTLTTLAELERQLAKIRRTGFARSRAESAEGIGSIAVAITDRHGVARGALSVSAPLTRVTPESEAVWIEATRDAADRLRARIWGKPEMFRSGTQERRSRELKSTAGSK
jgi:DNA-binding IclR family transcriptional regulator